MHVLNAARSSEYFDSMKDEREESAVRVIHWAWLEHSSTLARLEHLEPTSPLDMLVLYQAAAATFRDWTPGMSHPEELSNEGQIINREQAAQRIRSIEDPKLAALATRFANRVIALSDAAAAEQDLNYYVELFLRAVQYPQVIEGIVDGSISRDSRDLSDPDYW
jgi:hypothetical protein